MNRANLIFGALLCGALLLLAIVGPTLSPHLPSTQNLDLQFAPPSASHILGNGINGTDLFSQICWGARLSLIVGLGSVLISAFIGLVLGSMAGYFRGPFETLIMRLCDAIFAFPGILLVVALAALIGPGLWNMIAAMAISSWAGYARLTRALTLSLREQDFITAARAMGASPARIIFRHLWPNLFPLLMVQMSFGVGSAILTESTLSFLGIGTPIDQVTWGQMINQGRELILSHPRIILTPGIALMLTVLGLNLLGDGIRDYLDPKTQALKVPLR